jgi:hypothetical protein
MTIRGTVKNGQISALEPIAWPDGTEVFIRASTNAALDGVHGDFSTQADDSDSVARWIAEFDTIPGLDMTAQEEAAWQSARAVA